MLFLFVFGIAVLYIEYKIAGTLGLHYMKSTSQGSTIPHWSAQDQIRFIGLTIVVILAVFVIIIPDKPLETNLTAAVFGFFGTVVGYLAGSGRAPTEPGNNPPGNT